MDEGGFQSSQSTRTGQNPVTDGGLMIDDHDAMAIARPEGGFRLEKEKFRTFNFEYKHFLTSCTDPDWCWRITASPSLGWFTPGTTTQNTDWTKGGKGKAFSQRYEIGIHWGVAELTMEVGLGIAWASHRQNLAHDLGMAPTALPVGIKRTAATGWA